jgi:hypothetical protein
MKTITLTSTERKIDLLVRIAKERGIKTKPFRELTDEEMALPSPKGSKEQLENWLTKDDGEERYTPAQMKERVKKRLAKLRTKKNENHL